MTTTDFSTITACGECCVECKKKLSGECPGCIEADGAVPEWKESGRCKIHTRAGTWCTVLRFMQGVPMQ